MPLVPPYIESLRPYEAGRSIEEVQRAYGLTPRQQARFERESAGPVAAGARSDGPLHERAASLSQRRPGSAARLAEKFELKIENVIAGSGSEGIMSNIIRTFLCDEDEVLTTEAAFIGFQVLAKSRGVAYRTVPYRDWHYDLTGAGRARSTSAPRSSTWRIPTIRPARSSPSTSSTNSTATFPSAS